MELHELISQYSYEQLAHAMYTKGVMDGYPNVMAKNKWREIIMADRLGHTVFKRSSSGKHSAGYGADAVDSAGQTAEYKSSTLSPENYQKLVNGQPIVITGIYNGAYTMDSIWAYDDHDHYFGLFFEERCVMIYQINSIHVGNCLWENLAKKSKKSNKTTNLNTVAIRLSDTHLYETVYANLEEC